MPSLSAGLGGCTSTLQEQGARQEASLSDLRTMIEGLRGDLQGLRGEVTALRDALEIEVRRTTADRTTEEARARDAQAALDARLAANGHSPTTELMVEGAVLHLKADLGWLDLIEQRLVTGGSAS